MIQIFAFYLFAALTHRGAVFVILARNPVHSVLWLILAFFNAAGLMVLVGAEFIAMLLVIVYVGAVAVLFLFVVMMLDIDFAELRAGFVKNFPLGMLIALILVAELVLGHRRLPARARCQLGTPDGAAAAAARREQHREHRRAALQQVSVPVRSAGHHPAGRDDRRNRADPPRAHGRRGRRTSRSRSQRRPRGCDASTSISRKSGKGVEL